MALQINYHRKKKLIRNAIKTLHSLCPWYSCVGYFDKRKKKRFWKSSAILLSVVSYVFQQKLEMQIVFYGFRRKKYCDASISFMLFEGLHSSDSDTQCTNGCFSLTANNLWKIQVVANSISLVMEVNDRWSTTLTQSKYAYMAIEILLLWRFYSR